MFFGELTLLKMASLISASPAEFSEIEGTKCVLCLDCSLGFDPVGGVDAAMIISLPDGPSVF